MEPQPNRKLTASLLLLSIMAIPFLIMYYLSTDTYRERRDAWQQSTATAVQKVDSSVTAEKVTLAKNEPATVGRTSLVYKGLEKKLIQIDLYLLDLDPQQPFRVTFSKKEAKDQISIGDNKFRMISVNERFLTLEIISMFRTP